MKKLFISLVFLIASQSVFATIRYVNVNVVGGTGTGLSWANAYVSLQSALDVAVSGDQIWVAKGSYLPSKDALGNASPTDPRDKTFHLVNGVALYGGFVGTETLITQRVVGNVTILSGDIGTVGNSSDNSYHVVLSVSDANTTILDGFTISAGQAYGSAASITVETKTISRSNGGGMYNESSSPSLTNLIFLNNFSDLDGGGMYNSTSSPSITRVTFSGNLANFNSAGGGMCDVSSSPTLTNVLFSGNVASYGGGMCNKTSSSPVLTNVSFYANKAITISGPGLGGAMYNNNSTPIIKNSLFWGNNLFDNTTAATADIYNVTSPTSISFTAMQLPNNTTNYPTADFPNIGTSNNIFAQDPKFININNLSGSDGIFMTADDGLELKNISPCLNTGTASGASATDITGFARVSNPEMGAYEYNPATCPTFTIILLM